MHRRQNKADTLAYSSGEMNVQAIGLGHHDEGIERIGQALDAVSQGADLHGSNIQGWDFSVPRDLIYFDAERRVSRLESIDLVARDLLYAEAAVNSAHAVVIGSELWSFQNFGVTASGIPSTSAQNSPGRAFTLLVAGANREVAAGDDEVHAGNVDKALLLSAGQIVKPGSETSSPPEGPVDFKSCRAFRKPLKDNPKGLF